MMADKWEPGPDGIDAARAWLGGDIKKGSPPPRKLQAGRTLAWMLRNNPEAHLLCILADAIEDGRLVMKRKPGRRRKINDQHIAVFIYQRKKAGEKQESAVKEAMTKFNVRRSTVFGAWSKWRRRIEQNPELYGRI